MIHFFPLTTVSVSVSKQEGAQLPVCCNVAAEVGLNFGQPTRGSAAALCSQSTQALLKAVESTWMEDASKIIASL